FLFGEATGERPDAFDRRHRLACDLYNYGLGLALAGGGDAEPVVRFEAGKRRLPFGEIALRLDATRFQLPMGDVDRFLMADQFSVKGMSVRNRKGGVGVPLIALGREQADLQVRRAAPSTVFLRLPGSLREIERGDGEGVLELFSMFDAATVSIAGAEVPLEADFTAARAYVLGQRYAWASGRMLFLSPQPAMKSQLILSEPYRPGRIPLVLVHGTFSSPARWAEMMNTLNADPVIRSRYQIWMFLYGSSQPILISADLLRTELESTIARLDPEGRDEALRRMVVVGHSQGGLLTKLTATDTGSALWEQFSKKSPEELDMTEEQRATIQRLAFSKPLPFVETVVFIATPHRGSFRSGNLARHIVRKLVSLPQATLQVTSDLLTGVQGIESPEMFNGLMPSSVDGMSPKNPVMLALAEIPVAPGIDAHSIIAVKGDGPPESGDDGVVTYQSAHVDYVRSELVVRGAHSCQSMPATIEQVRRILREHLDKPAATTGLGKAP
nr:alpha/beta hydrolase [Opitutaceae bacterium]